MTTRRTRAIGPLLLTIGLVLGLALAAPAGATEPGPAYPPGAGADDVVTAGRGAGEGGAAGEGTGTGGAGGAPTAGAADEGGSSGPTGPGSESDGAGGAAEVGEPATTENPDPEDDPADDPADGPAGDEDASDEEEAAGEPLDAAPTADESRIGPILVVAGTAVLLAGAVVAIARRL